LETDILFGNHQGLTTEKTLDTMKQAVERNTAEKDLLPKFYIKDVNHLLQLIRSREKH
jgi:hypothetical protein